ncbi:MAG: hypothetical protein HOV81_28875 [Kofleriaceae bacterium]|nr:hypothetical protein [Kofleriaceae bacterium]
MKRLVVPLVVSAMTAGCSGDDGGGGNLPTYETLLEDDFSTFPFGWTWAGGGGPRSETDFGFPAPSGYVSGAGFVSPPGTFTFESQKLDAHVTAYLQNSQAFGEQYALLRVANDFTDVPGPELGYVGYRLITNRQADQPVAGYPAGNTAEVHCAFDGGTPVHVQVPYEDGAVAYDLFITVDSQGTRCGFDDTVVATTAATSVTGAYRPVLGATASSDAWFDNLIMRRAE